MVLVGFDGARELGEQQGMCKEHSWARGAQLGTAGHVEHSWAWGLLGTSLPRPAFISLFQLNWQLVYDRAVSI